jgi:membrane protease YdiL (CAAX protease family)
MSIWVAAVPAIVFGTIMLLALRLVGPSLLPIAAPSISIRLSSYPMATVIGALIALAIGSAVVEETAFRGYMQKPLEERYGILVAILIVGVMFWVAHLDKVTVTHLPGHIAASAVFGLLAYYSRSLAPAMVAHAATDLALQPAYFSKSPAFVWKALGARPLWEGHATTLGGKLQIILDSAKLSNLVSSGPHQTFAVLLWVFLLGIAFTAASFVLLVRASHK